MQIWIFYFPKYLDYVSDASSYIITDMRLHHILLRGLL